MRRRALESEFLLRGDPAERRNVAEVLDAFAAHGVNLLVLDRRTDADDREVEDYQITIVHPIADYGDAPAPYPTLAGGMVAPLSTMASLFAAPLRNLGYGLMQLKEQREGAEAA